MPRELPHKSVDPTFGLEVLKNDRDNLHKRFEYVLNQENSGDTIANHFEILTTKIFEVAIISFFLEGISPEKFMGMLRKSSLAACNYFKLVTNKGVEVQYEWEGKSCKVVYQGERTHHMADGTLNMGLRAAIIANQHQEIKYLSNTDLSKLGLNMMNGAFALRTLAMQSICNGGKKDYRISFDAIEKLPPPNRNRDAKLIHSECQTLLAIEKRDTDQLSKLIEDNLVIHKKMYDNDARNLRYNYFGLISTHNLASLILARKNKMIIHIENKYIPEELFEISIKNI